MIGCWISQFFSLRSCEWPGRRFGSEPGCRARGRQALDSLVQSQLIRNSDCREFDANLRSPKAVKPSFACPAFSMPSISIRIAFLFLRISRKSDRIRSAASYSPMLQDLQPNCAGRLQVSWNWALGWKHSRCKILSQGVAR